MALLTGKKIFARGLKVSCRSCAFLRHILFFYLFTHFFLNFVPPSAASHSFISSENELKTAFLYQFTKFVTWPHVKIDKKSLVIGVLSDQQMLDAIMNLEGKVSQGKKIVVVPVDNVSNLEGIDILYVEKGHFADEHIIDEAIKEHILTISDEDQATKKGIIIGLYMADTRLRFNINLKIADKSSLKLSSRLLRLADSLIKE